MRLTGLISSGDSTILCFLSKLSSMLAYHAGTVISAQLGNAVGLGDIMSKTI